MNITHLGLDLLPSRCQAAVFKHNGANDVKGWLFRHSVLIHNLLFRARISPDHAKQKVSCQPLRFWLGPCTMRSENDMARTLPIRTKT